MYMCMYKASGKIAQFFILHSTRMYTHICVQVSACMLSFHAVHTVNVCFRTMCVLCTYTTCMIIIYTYNIHVCMYIVHVYVSLHAYTFEYMFLQ